MKKLLFLLCSSVLLLAAGCKKEKDAHIPPQMDLRTGGNYTSADRTVMHGDSVLVGVVITKKEDDLKTYNISYAYDGASSTTTFYNYVMTTAEYNGYSKDTWIHTRNQAGTEKWVFTVTDRDGNLAQKSITLTVQ